jgi:hypothetical protein
LAQVVKRKFVDGKKPSDSDQRFQTLLTELAGRGVRLTFICSKGDPLLRDLRDAGGDVLKRLCRQGGVACDVVPKSDHTFSSLYDQERLVDLILKRANETVLTLGQQAQVPAVAHRPVEALF